MVLFPSTRERGVGVALTAGWLEGCVGAGWSAVGVEGCVRAHVGASHLSVASDEQVQASARDSELWAGTGGVVRARFELIGPLFAVLELEGLVAITRRRFVVRNRPDLGFREDAVSILGAAGIGGTL
jgi:hypothetical protein